MPGVGSIDQEAGGRVPAGQVHQDVFEQGISGHALEQGGQGPAQLGRVGESRGKLTNRPERLVDMIQEAWPTALGRMSPKGTSNVSGIVFPPTTVPSSLKSIKSPLPVLGDLGLGGVDLEVLGRPVADVGHPHPQGERLHRFDGGRQRLVRENFVRQDILQLEQGLGIDRDRVLEGLYVLRFGPREGGNQGAHP